MTCRVSATREYLQQWWLIADWLLAKKYMEFNQNTRLTNVNTLWLLRDPSGYICCFIYTLLHKYQEFILQYRKVVIRLNVSNLIFVYCMVRFFAIIVENITCLFCTVMPARTFQISKDLKKRCDAEEICDDEYTWNIFLLKINEWCFGKKLDESTARRQLKSPRSLSGRSIHLTLVTKWSWSWSWMTYCQPLCEMSIGSLILRYSYFKIWPWKSMVKVICVVKGQGHVWPSKFKGQRYVQGQTHWSHLSPRVQSICLLFVSWQSDHFWLRYSNVHIWPWKI